LRTPTACRIDSAIVGPTNVKPRERRAFESALGSSKVPSQRPTLPTSSRSSKYARAFEIVDRIFARLRTMPASASRRRSSRALKRATRSGSNPAKAARYAARLPRIVDHDRPA